jgi:hypothetical protein
MTPEEQLEAMTPDEQLDWEAGAGRLAGVAAFASALLAIASVVVYNGTVGSYSDSAELLIQLHKHPAAAIAGSVLQAIAIVLLIPVLLYLLQATIFRRPETPSNVRYLVLIAPPLAAILSVVTAALQVRAANHFNGHLLAPKAATDLADHYIRQSPAPLVGYLLFAVNFAVGGAIVLVSLNAMRAGLLSRFMGILGIILGALTAIPFFLGGPSIIQFFWLIALGLLFLDRWPGGGRGPAWDSGEAIPWPSAAQARQERLQPTADSRQPTESAIAGGAATATEHPRSKKRKRKRRR